MSNDEEKQEKRGFKVEDRRRFSDTGEVRPEYQNTAAERAAPGPGGAAAETPRREAPPTEAPRPERPSIELNFSTFVISLSTQALAHLGEIPDPISNQIAADLGAAKHMIDILGILKEKTKGNLDKSESTLLDNILYDLRLKYVERVRGRS